MNGFKTIKSRLGSALPPASEVVIDNLLFGAGARDPDTQAAVKAMFIRGFQQPGDMELNLGAAPGF